MQPAALLRNEHKDKAEHIAQEYEDFAYIVSHDLNAPLRHVKEFTRLLIGGRKEKLTEEEKEYVAFLEKSLQKLDEMQSALLSFSRLNTRAGLSRETDFNQSIAAALKSLEDAVNECNPVIECDTLPALMAEPQQIELLFFNLMDNALKFKAPGTSQQKISISAVNQGTHWLFTLKDNGIGIDSKYHEEVFRLFRRLEPEKHSGIGAGLTIARKIAQRHGGDMAIESEPGKGTSVLFSIGKV